MLKVQCNRFPGGLTKAMALSYDDGTEHDRKLVDILNRYSIRSAFHLISGSLDEAGYLTSGEIAKLFEGHEVSSHSVSHPHLATVSAESLQYELRESRIQLEKLVKYPVNGIAFPYGTYNDDVLEQLPRIGYQYARHTETNRNLAMPDQFLRWAPTCHHDEDLMEITTRFLQSSNVEDKMSLLFIFGHSHDFDRHNNWGLIEEFCKRMEGREDVWNATPSDIVNYMTGLRRLVFSVAQDIVHNPSAMPLWIEVDQEAIQLPPGSTTQLGI